MATTVITGAAGALGSAVARVLSAYGHRLVLVDLPAAETALVALAGALGKGSVAVAMDLRDPAQWARALDQLGADEAPSGAALVAGGWRGGKPLHDEDDATFASMMAMNLETVHRSLRALLPGMVARRRGSIVVVGSRAAVLPASSANAASYAASKAAAVALAEAAAAEVLAHGVRVNAILPSTIDTPANRRAMPSADPSRWVAPESIAEVIAFLLSDAARDVSGAAIPVYGRA